MVPHVGAIAELGVDQRDLFVARTQVGVKGVNLRFAKVVCDRQMLVRGQLGHMQHECFVLDECSFERLQRFGQEHVGEIEIKHLGANCGAERTDIKG